MFIAGAKKNGLLRSQALTTQVYKGLEEFSHLFNIIASLRAYTFDGNLTYVSLNLSITQLCVHRYNFHILKTNGQVIF